MTKRLFDVISSSIALLVMSPVLLVIAALIKVDSPGPVLFCQARLGKGARTFQICKFRTMVSGSPAKGSRITVGRDPRVTRLGRILRRFDLDELPTLFNVLKGEMSIVGPRPEVPEYLAYYTAEQRRIFSVKPGLTDLGTLAFRNEASLLISNNQEQLYIHEILPRKLALNLEYVRRQSFLFDLAIIFKTLTTVLFQYKA